MQISALIESGPWNKELTETMHTTVAKATPHANSNLTTRLQNMSTPEQCLTGALWNQLQNDRLVDKTRLDGFALFFTSLGVTTMNEPTAGRLTALYTCASKGAELVRLMDPVEKLARVKELKQAIKTCMRGDEFEEAKILEYPNDPKALLLSLIHI